MNRWVGEFHVTEVFPQRIPASPSVLSSWYLRSWHILICHELNTYGDAWMRCGNTFERMRNICVRDIYSSATNSIPISPAQRAIYTTLICVDDICSSATNSIPISPTHPYNTHLRSWHTLIYHELNTYITNSTSHLYDTHLRSWHLECHSFVFVTYTHLPRTQYLYYQRNESSIWRSFAFVTFRMTLICVRDIYSSATNSMSHLNINSTSHLHRRRRLNFK